MIKVQSILVQVPPISKRFPFSNVFEFLLSAPSYYSSTGAKSPSVSGLMQNWQPFNKSQKHVPDQFADQPEFKDLVAPLLHFSPLLVFNTGRRSQMLPKVMSLDILMIYIQGFQLPVYLLFEQSYFLTYFLLLELP